MKIKKIAYHRNGICGAPFHVVLFSENKAGNNMMAIVFDAPCHVAVLDVDETKAGNIEFAMGNSWRGDIYEEELRRAVLLYEDA